LKIIENGIWNS